MQKINEIASDVYRISIYVPRFDLQFNHFLVKDDESLLFHTGYKGMFSEVHEAVKKIINPSQIRWAVSAISSQMTARLNLMALSI